MNSMRKWPLLAGVLVLMLLLAATGRAPLAFAVGPEVRITPSSVQVPPGGTVTVDLEVVAPPNGLGGWTIEVTYTNSVVTATCQGLQGFCNVPTVGTVRSAGFQVPPGLTGTVALARLTFQATGAAGSTSPLHLVVRDFTDPDGTPITPPPTVTDGLITIRSDADLAVTLADAPDPIVATRPLTYTATITNNGPQTATGVTLTDTIPAKLLFGGASSGCTLAGSTLTCPIGTLASGASATVTLTGQPQEDAQGVVYTLSNTACVTATEFDPDQANNCATTTTTVNPIDGPQWKQQFPEPDPTGGRPAPRGGGSDQALGYDPVSNRMMFFSGGERINGTGHLNDTWVLINADGFDRASGATVTPQWQQLATVNTPAGRDNHAGAYDVRNNVLMVYGGCTGGCTPIDTNVYALDHANGLGGTPTWRLVPTVGVPTMRVATTATYDAATNRLMVFGGDNCCGTRPNHIWVLTNANGLDTGPSQWLQLSPAAPLPAGRTSHTAEYDYTNNRLIVFGGNTNVTPYVVTNDVWVLTHANGLGETETPQWVQLSPAGAAPAPRSGHLSLYDQATNRMMIFGGYDGTNVRNDMWVLTCANGRNCPAGEPAWQQLNPFGLTIPPGRSGTLAVHNSVSNRLVLWSGWGGEATGLLTDLWVLKNANGLLGGRSANLKLTATALPVPVGANPNNVPVQLITVGNFVAITLTVTNLGPTTATGTRVTHQLPDYMDLLSSAEDTIVITPNPSPSPNASPNSSRAAPTRSCSVDAARIVHCDLGDLAANETVTITISDRVRQNGTHTGSVSISANEIDPLPDDNSARFQYTAVGDVNNDHAVTIVDALCVVRAVAGVLGSAACPSPLPPYICNSGLTIVCALCVARAVAGLPPTTACRLYPLAPPAAPQPRSAAGPEHADTAQAGSADVTLRTTGPATVAPGAEATITVVNSGSRQPGAWTVDLAYDPAVLTPVRCQVPDGQCNTTYSRGLVRLTGAALSGLAPNAALGTVTFRAIGAAGRTSALTPQVSTLTDPVGTPLRTTATAGRLTITAGSRGGDTPTPTPTPTTCPRGGCTVSTLPTATPTPTATPPCLRRDCTKNSR